MSTRFSIASLIAVAALAFAACSSSPPPSPSASPTASVAVSAAPSAAPPSVSPSVAPSVAPTTAPSTAPSATPVASLAPAESALLDVLRADSRIDCAPRRNDLPPGSITGIECHPNDPLVAAVGVYAFSPAKPVPALTAYLARLADAKVAVGSGDCAKGIAGDHAWPANLPDEGDSGSGPRETRAGCFLDANGIANIRVTCYGDIYIGVLGNTKELANLNAWTWKVADGDSVDRDPPGICALPD
jgi:hypothetical protein